MLTKVKPPPPKFMLPPKSDYKFYATLANVTLKRMEEQHLNELNSIDLQVFYKSFNLPKFANHTLAVLFYQKRVRQNLDGSISIVKK